MKNKVIIAIIFVLLCVCAVTGAVQHFGNNKEENSNLTATDASAEQITDEEETSLTDISEETDSALTEINTKSTSASKETNTETTSQPEKTTVKTTTASKAAGTTTKQQTTTAPNTTKAQTTAKTTENQKITVTVSINCKTALKYGAEVPKSGYFYSPAKQNAANGATAFDVLEKVCRDNGISLTYQQKTYIQAIGGLAEKDCGGASGWTYKVNGIKPLKSASKYVLSDGDIVEWYYVTSPND